MNVPSAPPTAVAKVTAPAPRPEAIARGRLTAALEVAAVRPLTLVAAPAGYGKTTAVVQWLRAADRRHAWLSVEANDNDPRWFGSRLLAALDRALPGERLEPARRAFEAGSALDATVVPLLAEAIAEDRGPGLTIVLDDYHLIYDEACHRVAGRLVDSLPGGASVLVASRRAPPLRLARRRAAGTIAELGPEQLRFEPDEAERLLNEALGLGLGREQLALLEERLHGWPAGLALVAEAISGRPDRAGLLDALERSRRDLDAYLTEEVLEAARPELADFLLRTSVLGRLCAPLCQAVVGDPAAAELLEEVRRLNLFVTALDPQGEWLRYHDMFAAALAGELVRRHPELAGESHGRASRWFEREGMADEAMEHALLAGDGPRAAALLAESWMGLIAERRHVTVRRILERLPEDRGELGPLCEALGLLCMIYEGVDQRVTARRARALAASHGDDPAVRLVVDGILISPFYGDVGSAVEIGREALERYAELPPARDQIVGQVALALWFAGEYERVRELLEPRVRLPQPIFLDVWTLAILALTAADEEDAEMAERYAREAMAKVVAAHAETATEFAAVPWVVGEALRLRGKLEEARRHLDRGLENEARRPGSVGHAVALVYDAQLALAEGEGDRARQSAARARDIVDRYPDLGTLPERLSKVEAALPGSAGNALLGSDPSPAELRVLALLESDRTLAEVAAELYLSRDTVKSHTHRLYRRLGAGSRAEAVAAARRRGLLQEPARPQD